MFRVIGLLVSIILMSADAMREINAQFFPLQQSSNLSLRGKDRGWTRIVPLYRGINFCSDIFDEQKRADFISNHVPGENVLESLHIDQTTQWILKYNAKYNIDISEDAIRQHQIFNTNFMFQYILRQNKIKNNMVLRDSLYKDYHKGYSNHYSSNSGYFNLNQYGTQFVANPFLSFSKNPKHAVKYAYGVNKSYAGHSPLTAQYASDGSLQIGPVGVVQVVFVREEDLLKLGVCDVNKEIGRPWRRIGNENEVSLDGCAFSENFVLQISAKLPSLTSKSQDCSQLGISDTVKKNWRQSGKYPYYINRYVAPRLEEFINSQVKNFAKENKMKIVQLKDFRRH